MTNNQNNPFYNKIILITGGTGSIGASLVTELIKYQPKQIRIFSRDQNKQYELIETFNHHPNLRLLIGDIRDEKRLNLALENVDIIFHAAALKHVPSCEYNPFEAVKTNIIGSQNVIEVALARGVEKVIAISTDKVVNPTNVMGTSKLMMEKLFISANYYRGSEHTKFACVRFGNVTWSNASVLPLWKKQIEKNSEIRITDKNMTRFFISREQAAQLVLEAAGLMQGGEVFVLKMPSIKLINLAKLFIAKHASNQKINIKLVGNRGNEKIHEGLFSEADIQNQIFENKEMLIILPHQTQFINLSNRNYPGFKPISSKTAIKLSSAKNINISEIRKII